MIMLRLSINLNKTKAMIFGPRIKETLYYNIEYRDTRALVTKHYETGRQ